MVAFIMLANSIFKDVEYPSDRKSIEHIIREYDKVLEYKLYGDKTTKKQMYIAQFFCIVIIAYIFKCSWISLIIRTIYMMPLAICLIYNIILFRKVKKVSLKIKNCIIDLIFVLIY